MTLISHQPNYWHTHTLTLTYTHIHMHTHTLTHAYNTQSDSKVVPSTYTLSQMYHNKIFPNLN